MSHYLRVTLLFFGFLLFQPSAWAQTGSTGSGVGTPGGINSTSTRAGSSQGTTPPAGLSDITESPAAAEMKVGDTELVSDNNALVSDDATRPLSSIEQTFQVLLPVDAPPLRQYGYDVFRAIPGPVSTNVSPSYILGAGDQLAILVWGDPVDLGELPALVPAEVNKSGGLFYAPVGLVPVAGSSLQEAERAMKNGLGKKYKRFELRLSLTQFRQFPITVSGFVAQPGVVSVSAGASVLDALGKAGGINRNGSLRQLQIKSLDGDLRIVDLYDVLVRGQTLVSGIREGDTLFVPPLGKTAGIWGAVKRPGIYELGNEDHVSDLVAMAGGTGPEALVDRTRITTILSGLISVSPHRLDDPGFLASTISDGTVLEVARGSLDIDGGVLVSGVVSYPGWYNLQRVGSLSSLIGEAGLKVTTDMDHAQVLRTDPKTFDKTAILFSPRKVLERLESPELRPSDQVRFFPKGEFDPVTVVGEVEFPLVIPYSTGLTLEGALALAKLASEPKTLKVQLRGSTGDFQEVYLGDRYRLASVLPIPLAPGTAVVVKRLDPVDKTPLIVASGRLNRPGSFVFTRGTTLSKLIEMAGGPTEDAFLQGLVVSRPSIGESQKEKIDRATESLQTEIASLLAELESINEPIARSALRSKIASKQSQIEIIRLQLTRALGRIAVDLPSDWQQLKGSANDLELEDEDSIFLPSVPRYVLVMGSVYNQGAQSYRAGITAREALENAGGATVEGDLDRLHIVRANGIVVKPSASFFGVGGTLGTTLGLGDAVVLPTKDTNSIDAWGVFKETLQVLGTTMGLTANSLAILATLGLLN